MSVSIFEIDTTEQFAYGGPIDYQLFMQLLDCLSRKGYQFRRQYIISGCDASMNTINAAVLDWPIDNDVFKRYSVESILMEFVNSKTGEVQYMEMSDNGIEVLSGYSEFMEKYSLGLHYYDLGDPNYPLYFYENTGNPDPFFEGNLLIPFPVFEKQLHEYNLLDKYSIIIKLFSNEAFFDEYKYLGQLEIESPEKIKKAKEILNNGKFCLKSKLKGSGGELEVYSNKDNSCIVYVLNEGSSQRFIYADDMMAVEYVLDFFGVRKNICLGFLKSVYYD